MVFCAAPRLTVTIEAHRADLRVHTGGQDIRQTGMITSLGTGATLGGAHDATRHNLGTGVTLDGAYDATPHHPGTDPVEPTSLKGRA